MKLARTGTPITSHRLMAGVLSHHKPGGPYLNARSAEHPLKRYLRSSRNRKAPITLPSAPFDHKDDKRADCAAHRGQP
jgi:hypothetical protein